jgi:hypothetical protein
MPRRTHSKVEGLKVDVRKAVEKLMLAGETYESITEYLKTQGVAIGRSSVGRWGKDFARRLERLNLAARQAEAIVRETGDRPATEINEAAEKIATQALLDILLALPEDAAEMKLKDACFAIAALQDSAVRRERAKLAFSKEAEGRAKKAADEIGKLGTAKGIDEATIREIQQKVFNIATPAGGK